MKAQTDRRLEQLEAQGFDGSYVGEGNRIRIKCNQCEVVAINGVPCHETGCPNQRHECKGCNNLIPMRQTYCEDCQ